MKIRETDGELVEIARTMPAETKKSVPGERTDDPVRLYLREMGSVELLSREGEIAIAKRIEAGREAMIAGLCESPLTFQAIIIWRDPFNDGKVFLRDIIDLEATYAGPDAKNVAALVPTEGAGNGAAGVVASRRWWHPRARFIDSTRGAHCSHALRDRHEHRPYVGRSRPAVLSDPRAHPPAERVNDFETPFVMRLASKRV
jgi:hypothetical protein